MRILLHAGLHKSATTFVQAAWGQAYRDSEDVWYPARPDDVITLGHHYLTWPLLRAYTVPTAPDLELARLTRGANMESLAGVVEEAETRGVDWLVISSEDLDRVRQTDVPGIEDSLRGHRVTLLVTATHPAHRWCATWQSLVKHGLAEHPGDAAEMLEDLASLRPGRLEEILRLLPATERVVRLVRPTSTSDDLPRELALAVGLPDPGPPRAPAGRNRSIGTDIEVVRRINAADLAMGLNPEGRRLLVELRGDGFVAGDAPASERYAVSARAWEAAEVERAFLASARTTPDLRVDDPLGLLGDWLDPTLPEWYETLSRSTAAVSGLPERPDPGEQLWRVRQQRTAYQSLLRVAEAEAADRDRRQRRRMKRLVRRNAELARRLAEAEAEAALSRGRRRRGATTR